jgi:4-amino-4-deoxy-L-arabinose transferase-like glycosyltransferase
MVEHGALLFPLLNNKAPSYKPPLYHWTSAALSSLLRSKRVNEFNLRLPSAIYGIAGIVLTFFFVLDWLGLEAAVLAALVLLGSYQYVSQARIGRVDMALTFFENAALLGFFSWYKSNKVVEESSQSQQRRWLKYTTAATLGLAVLTKGPVGAVLPLLSIVIFLAAERQLGNIFEFFGPGPLVILIVLGSSWYLACALAGNYGFLRLQLGAETFGRFLGALGWMPPWYYVVPLFLNSVPFSLIAPLAVVAAVLEYHLRESRDEGSDSIARGLAIFWIVTVVFFSIAAYKRRAYLLPMWPSAAALLAWWTMRGTGSWRLVLRWGIVGAALVSIVFHLVALPQHEARQCAGDEYRETAADIRRVVGDDEPLFSWGFEVDPAPLLFYLDRNVPAWPGKLGDAPPGYIIAPEDQWRAHRHEGLDLRPVFERSSGNHPIVLLRHGETYAMR